MGNPWRGLDFIISVCTKLANFLARSLKKLLFCPPQSRHCPLSTLIFFQEFCHAEMLDERGLTLICESL